MDRVILAIGYLVQGAATVALVIVTWRYVKLTKRLVDLQIEPRLDIEIPKDQQATDGPEARIVNNAGCDVDRIRLIVSVVYPSDDNRPENIHKCIDSRTWDGALKPGDSVTFGIGWCLDLPPGILKQHVGPVGMEFVGDLVLLALAFRRTADGREFCFREPYSVIHRDSGVPSLCKSGPRERLENLDAYILRRKKS